MQSPRSRLKLTILRFSIVVVLAVASVARAQDAVNPASSSPSSEGVAATEVSEHETSDGGIPISRLIPARLRGTAAISVGYDYSTSGAGGGSGSAFSRLELGANYSFSGPRLSGGITAGSAFDYYFDRADNAFQPNGHLGLSLGYAVSERLSLAASLSGAYQSRPNIAISAAAGPRAGDFFSSGVSLSGSYQWLPRFSTTTSLNADLILYDGHPSVGGTVLINQVPITQGQDRVTYGAGQQLRLLLLPETALTGDYLISEIHYRGAGGDALSQSILGGVEQTLGPRLRGSFRGGVQFYQSDRGVFGSSDTVSPQGNVTLTYQVGAETSLSFLATYAIEPSDVATAGGRQTFRTGLQLSHTITARLSGTASVYYRYDTEQAGLSTSLNSGSFTERSFDLSLGLAYALNSHLSATLNYQLTETNSDLSSDSYYRNSFLLGVSMAF